MRFSPNACAMLVDFRLFPGHQSRVVLDNPRNPSPGALYDAFPAPEARPDPAPPGSHYNPQACQPGSTWIEIEIGVLRISASTAPSTSATLVSDNRRL